MTDKTPSDAELKKLYLEETGFDLDESPAALLDFARAVLAKWGQPAQAAEPVAWMVETEQGVMLWPADDYKEALTYCDENESPQPLYTAPQPSQAAEPVADGLPLVIAGAIYDFAGFLTTRKKVIEVGSTANAAPIADLVQEWAAKRNLSLKDAAVLSWQEHLSAPQPARQPLTGLSLAVIGRRHFGNPIPREWYSAARDLEASHGITGGQHGD